MGLNPPVIELTMHISSLLLTIDLHNDPIHWILQYCNAKRKLAVVLLLVLRQNFLCSLLLLIQISPKKWFHLNYVPEPGKYALRVVWVVFFIIGTKVKETKGWRSFSFIPNNTSVSICQKRKTRKTKGSLSFIPNDTIQVFLLVKNECLFIQHSFIHLSFSDRNQSNIMLSPQIGHAPLRPNCEYQYVKRRKVLFHSFQTIFLREPCLQGLALA